MSLRRLIQDRELDLLDGSKLLAHDKYDALSNELAKQNIDLKLNQKILRIHPSFRVIATGEPPVAKSTFKDPNGEKKPDTPNRPNSNISTEWLNSEVLNLFLYQIIEPLEQTYEHEILSKKFKLNQKHEKLLDLMEKLKKSGDEEAQLRHISKLFSLRKLIRLSNKLEKYENLDLKELIENASLYKFMPQLNKQILNEFLAKNQLDSQDETFIDLENLEKLKETNSSLNNFESISKSLSDLAKIPDTLFYENKLHSIILNNLIRDFELGEHLLLIGNQGTGKNKLVDKFLMLTKKPREYIQLHRDTTVHSLTVQPVIKNGVIHYEDSPLVKAIKEGNVLVIDEADKAPLHVTCILKSLIESGEMILSDGRRIVNSDFEINEKDKDEFIRIHKNFRMIILANRPGFPFLGNDFFSILGDLLSCHPIDNPDPQSEIEMLRMYAPNVSDKILSKLVSAFGSLRQLSDQGLIAYPYSTREIVNIVKHLEKYPDDSLANVLANVYDFDYFAEQSDLKSTFKEVMNKHGIPIGASTFQINLAPPLKLPSILPAQNFILKKIDLKLNSIASLQSLDWQSLKEPKVEHFKLDRTEARVDSFTELRSSWSLSEKQKLISDMLVSKNDLVYICGVKPLNLIQLNTQTNEAIEIDLTDYFTSAWRTYYPRLKLLPLDSDSNSILLYEETNNSLFKINFDKLDVSKPDKTLLKGLNLFDSARKTISKYFLDQNQTHKMLNLAKNKFISWRFNSNQLAFVDLNKNLEINFNLDNFSEGKLRVNNLVKIKNESLLICAYDSSQVQNVESLKAENFVYFILDYPNELENLDDIKSKFGLSLVDRPIFGTHEDLVLGQVEIKQNLSKNTPQGLKDLIGEQEAILIPTIKNHFVLIQNSLNETFKSFSCKRENSLRDESNFRNFKFQNQSPSLKSVTASVC